MIALASGVLPPAVVLPLACVAVLVISAHLAAMAGAHEMPLSRRRIRTASGVVMLVTTLALAYAFAYAGTDRPRHFTMVWAVCIMLVTMVLVLGGIDAFNNLRLVRVQRRRIRRSAGSLERRLVEALGRGGSGGAGRDDEPRLRFRDDPPDGDAET